MPNADYRVNVYAEAIPYSDTYYRLSDPDKLQVDAQFGVDLAQIIQLPPQVWHNLAFSNTNYDQILSKVNAMLAPAVTPPQGQVLVLPSQHAVGWKPTSTGHAIGFMARLQDSSGNISSWELNPVNFKNAIHLARVGFSYLCVPS